MLPTPDAHPANSLPPRPVPIDTGAQAALLLLRQARTCAQDVGADPWDFALEIGKLLAAGLTINELRSAPD